MVVMDDRMPRAHRVSGALVGLAVGNALAAPFLGSAPGAFSDRFPTPARGRRTEMCGGGPLQLDPGGTTDDVQEALLLATSLVEHGGLDGAEPVDGEPGWLAPDPPHVRGPGPSTMTVLDLTSRASRVLARAVPAALSTARAGRDTTIDTARRLDALTGGDASSGEASAVFADLLRAALDGGDPLAAVEETLQAVGTGRGAGLLDPDAAAPDPVRAALARALGTLRAGPTPADVLRRAVDLGGDTVAVAGAAGALTGAVHGIATLPIRWTSVLHGPVPGAADKDWWLADLDKLAARLDGAMEVTVRRPLEHGPGPEEVTEGVWAADLDGARTSPHDFAVISLCRTGTRFEHPLQRFAHLTDDDANPEIDAVLADVLDDMAALRAEGRHVLVHCYAGQSRTGLVLRAWLRRTQGLSVEEATAAVLEHWPYLSTDNESFTAALERMG